MVKTQFVPIPIIRVDVEFTQSFRLIVPPTMNHRLFLVIEMHSASGPTRLPRESCGKLSLSVDITLTENFF
jgi:hypothetical protein